MQNTAQLTCCQCATTTGGSAKHIRLYLFPKSCATASAATGKLLQTQTWRSSIDLSPQLELPPRLTSKSTSSVQAPPIKPTLILVPRRALWIISRRHANRGVEYQIHWNNGRNSWELLDSLYRDYSALIDKFLTGRH